MSITHPKKPCNIYIYHIQAHARTSMSRKRNKFNLSSKQGGNTPHPETSSVQGLCEGHQKALTLNALKEMMENHDEPCMMEHDNETC